MAVRGSRLTRALLLGVVVVALLGSVAALTVSSAQRRTAAQSAGHLLDTAGRLTAAASRPAVSSTRSGIDVQPVAGPSNNQTVQLSSSARAHPRADQVEQLLQAYFDAINNHDYDAWAAVVTPAQTKHQDSGRWLQAYASTVDSTIWVQSLSGDPLRVTLRFTSQQDPGLAPPDLQVSCIDWVLSFALDDSDGRLVVGPTVPGTGSKTKCP